MPHISISMYSGRTEEQKRDIAAKTKQAIVDACGFPPEALSVSVREYDPDVFEASVKQVIADDVLYETSDHIK